MVMGMVDENHTIIDGGGINIISDGFNTTKLEKCKYALGEIKLGENICPDGSAIYYTESMHPVMPLFAFFCFFLGMLLGWYMHYSITNIRATKKERIKK